MSTAEEGEPPSPGGTDGGAAVDETEPRGEEEKLETGGLLAEWAAALDPTVFELPVLNPHARDTAGTSFAQRVQANHVPSTGFASLCATSLFSQLPLEQKLSLVSRVAAESPRSPLAKAMGAMVALAAADATGHWFEFMDACDRPGTGRKQALFEVEKLVFTAGSMDKDRPHPNAPGGKPACFSGSPLNKFFLQMGQWTDDCSMGLAIADSLIVKRAYDGSDIRMRFWNWWNCGYCNAFRKDTSLGPRPSIGLGGNISKSIHSMREGERPSEIFHSLGEDSGNGSLMRLAPIPIFFATPMEGQGPHGLGPCMDAAKRSSLTTHPGQIAAECCALMAFLVARAIHDPRLPIEPGGELTARAWLEEQAAVYLSDVLGERTGVGLDEVRKLLLSAEAEGSLERNWNWRNSAAEGLPIEATLAARGFTYNGHPVSAGYFGSYAPDGLAVALFSVAATDSLDLALERCINFLGDADTTGAIAGQLAGAIYGIGSLKPAFVENLQQWDDGEVAVRAYLLLFLGQEAAAGAAAGGGGYAAAGAAGGAAATDQYYTISNIDGSMDLFDAADNAIIQNAQAEGMQTVRLPPKPYGEFEIRFADHGNMWDGLAIQVNLANGNTRKVGVTRGEGRGGGQ